MIMTHPFAEAGMFLIGLSQADVVRLRQIRSLLFSTEGQNSRLKNLFFKLSSYCFSLHGFLQDYYIINLQKREP